MSIDMPIEAEPQHTHVLDQARNHRERVAYACEQQLPGDVRTVIVQQWLQAHGWNIPRPTVSTALNEWRRARSMADTNEQQALTDATLAELDSAMHMPDNQADDDEALPDGESDSVTPEPAPVLTSSAVSDTPLEDVPDTPAAESSLAQRVIVGESKAGRVGAAILLSVVGLLLMAVIIAPIALSSQDIIHWARDSHGLGLTGVWPVITFIALDAAAAMCVGLVVYCSWRGESPGVFAWLVWAFAGVSAFANYQFGSRPGAPDDAIWFFPVMAVMGPFLLEMLTRRVRKWMQEKSNQRVRHGVSFGVARWIPGVGHFRDTYGAWRLARLSGIDDADEAVTAYRRLCPDGKLNIVKRLREQASSN